MSQTTPHETKPAIKLERTIKASAEQVYKAFLDPALLTRFQTPEGTEAIYDAFTAEVGAENAYAFRSGEHSMGFKIKFLELIEFSLIRHSYQMDMPAPMDVMMEIQIHLEEHDGVTKVRFEQYGLPEPIPVDKASEGWAGMLERLQLLLEA